MGLLDRLRDFIDGAAGGIRSSDPRGPLGLGTADAVLYYGDRCVVTGVRVIEGEGILVYEYCLLAPDENRLLLVAETGEEPVLSLQRQLSCDVPWDRDDLTIEGEEPFHVVRTGTARVKLHGDTGLRSTKYVQTREFEDESGVRMLVLANFGNTQEARVGEAIYEPELAFEIGGRTELRGTWGEVGVVKDEDELDDLTTGSVRKGSPSAAARSLDGHPFDDDAFAFEEDHDPTAYDDDEWADARDPEQTDGTLRDRQDVIDRGPDWLVATRYVAGAEDTFYDETCDDDWLSSK